MPAWFLTVLRWLANMLLLPLLKEWTVDLVTDGINSIKNWWKKRKEAKQEKKSEEKFEEVVQKPETTREERQHAEEDFLNGN